MIAEIFFLKSRRGLLMFSQETALFYTLLLEKLRFNMEVFRNGDIAYSGTFKNNDQDDREYMWIL
jgi:hypothetical protein